MGNRGNLVAGTLLLVLAAVTLWWTFRPAPRLSDSGPSGKSAGRDSWTPGSGATSTRDKGHASKTVRTLPADAPEPTHAPEDLKDFLLPEFRVENANLDEALDALFDLYHEVCRETGEVPVAFRYRIQGTPAGPISITSHSSLLATLRVLAAFSGADLVRDGSLLTFTAATPEPKASVVTESIKVAPSFVADLLAFHGTEKIDPFSNLTEQMRAMNLLQKGSSASFLPANATLVVKAPPGDRARLQALLDEVLLQPPVMFRNQYRIIESTEALDFPNSGTGPDGPGMAGMLTDAEAQSWVRIASATEGVDLLNQPTVISRAGQAATIQTGQEYATPSQLVPAIQGSPGATGTGFFPTTPEPTWTGERARINTGGYGFATRSTASFDSRTLNAPAVEGQLPSISATSQESIFTLDGDQWGVLYSTKEDGTHRYTLLNVQRVGADGTGVPRGK